MIGRYAGLVTNEAPEYGLPGFAVEDVGTTATHTNEKTHSHPGAIDASGATRRSVFLERVERVLVAAGDPEIAPSGCTGGLLPSLGGVRTGLTGQARLTIPDQLPSGQLWANVPDNRSLVSNWGPTAIYVHWDQVASLDAYAVVVCGSSGVAPNNKLEQMAHWVASLLVDAKQQAVQGPYPGSARRSAQAGADAGLSDSPTSRAATAIQRILGWSDSDLAGLFGVTRQAWRAWIDAKSVPRPRRRGRLYLLQRVLEARATSSPNEAVREWFEAPIGPGRTERPADLFSSGRDRFLAAIAVSKSESFGDRILPGRSKLKTVVNRDAVEARLHLAGMFYSDDDS